MPTYSNINNHKPNFDSYGSRIGSSTNLIKKSLKIKVIILSYYPAFQKKKYAAKENISDLE